MYRIVVFLCVFVSSCPSIAQETLRYSLKKGDTFTILQEASQEIIQELPESSQIIHNEISGVLHFEVVNSTTDTYTLEISFKKFSMRMTSPTLGEMMSLDTDIASNTFEHNMFVGMLDKPMQLVMRSTGEITHIINGNAIIEGMLDNLTDLDDNTRTLLKTQLEKDWKAEVLSESFEQMTFLYPVDPQKIGDSWENFYAGEGKVEAKNTWTLKSSNEDTRTLSAQADIKMNLSTDVVELQLTGNQSSQVTTLSKSGFIKTLIVQSIATGDSVMLQAPDVIIPTTINSLTTYTLQ